MATITIQDHWNSSSQFIVSARDDAGNYIGALGTVYRPRGRMWATVMEHGHEAFKDVIGHAKGVDEGAQMLLQRFHQGMNPAHHA